MLCLGGRLRGRRIIILLISAIGISTLTYFFLFTQKEPVQSPRGFINAKSIKPYETHDDNVYDTDVLRDKIYNLSQTDAYKVKWKQEAPNSGLFSYNDSLVHKKRLHVILAPHSHNDPGWLTTFDNYYYGQTKNIFDNMVSYMADTNQHFTFHWTESVSLIRWYRAADKISREKLIRIIKEGRFMINSGTWAMPDEASSRIYSLVENIIIGHNWVHDEFGVMAEYNWANDPFGHSDVIPLLYKLCGIKAVVINRIDMLLKKSMRESGDLEFLWRLPYKHDYMFTHMLPYEVYRLSHSLGIEPNKAQEFDFSPAEQTYRESDSSNIKHRADELNTELRQKSSFYKHNVVLVPVGDDFRYITGEDEQRGVSRNFNYISKYYNAHKDKYDVNITFGTMKDYFQLVEKIEDKTLSSPYKKLRGDFFPYNDKIGYYTHAHKPHARNAHNLYWTGYFTTRPHFKSRLYYLEILLRSAEIQFSQLLIQSLGTTGIDIKLLSDARETMCWLLHHDAITGTSPEEVMSDFLKHLNKAIGQLEIFSTQVTLSRLSTLIPTLKSNISTSLQNLVVFNKPSLLSVYDPNSESHEEQPSQRAPPVIDLESHNKSIILNGKTRQQYIILYNPLSQSSETIIHFTIKLNKVPVSNPLSISLKDIHTNKYLTCQIAPYITPPPLQISSTHFEVSALIEIESLSYRYLELEIQYGLDGTTNSCKPATLTVYNQLISHHDGSMFRVIPGAGNDIKISSTETKCVISTRNGALKSINDVSVKSGYKNYTKEHDSSGLYMFDTDGETQISHDNAWPVIHVSGVIEDIVISEYNVVTQAIRVNQNGVWIDIRVKWISRYGDLVWYLDTDINTNDIFHTDSNSFRTKRRRYWNKSRVAANFYPITNHLYIADNQHRFNVITRQPLGASSHSTRDGSMVEVMLDRRHNSYDTAGVDELLTDTHIHQLQFMLDVENSQYTLFPHQYDFFQHPLLIYKQPEHTSLDLSKISTVSQAKDVNLDCGVKIVSFRSMDVKPQTPLPGVNTESELKLTSIKIFSLVLMREENNECSPEPHQVDTTPIVGVVNFSIVETTLNLLTEIRDVEASHIFLESGDIKTYKITIPANN